MLASQVFVQPWTSRGSVQPVTVQPEEASHGKKQQQPHVSVHLSAWSTSYICRPLSIQCCPHTFLCG